MGIMLLSFISVILFCFSARQLLKAITIKDYWHQHLEHGLSRKAMRIGRVYKIFAWASLSLFLFVSMTASFIETFQQI